MQNLIIYMTRTGKISFIQRTASWPVICATLVICTVGISDHCDSDIFFLQPCNGIDEHFVGACVEMRRQLLLMAAQDIAFELLLKVVDGWDRAVVKWLFEQHFEPEDFGWENTYRKFVDSHFIAVFCVDCSWSTVIVVIYIDQAATKADMQLTSKYFERAVEGESDFMDHPLVAMLFDN